MLRKAAYATCQHPDDGAPQEEDARKGRLCYLYALTALGLVVIAALGLPWWLFVGWLQS